MPVTNAALKPRAPRGRPRRSETDAEKDRARILRTAEKLFAKGGYEGVSMRTVASAAGCSPASLYTLFPNKRALLRNIWEDALGDLDRALASTSHAVEGPVERLKQLGAGYVNFWRAHPDHFRAAFMIEDRVVDPGELYFVDTSENLGRMASHFSAAAVEAVDTGLLQGPALEIVELTFCALHGVASGLIAMPEYRWQTPDKLAAKMMEAVLAGRKK